MYLEGRATGIETGGRGNAEMSDDTLANALAWLRHTHPVSERFGRLVRATDLSGKAINCWMHLLPDTILTLMPFVEAGAKVRVGACNPDSTNDRVVAHLRENGVEVFPSRGASADAYQAALARFAAEPADAICDMGGELIEATLRGGHTVSGALEATTTGLHRLDGLPLSFPVFDWNSIRLKDALHNRYHVGDETWPAFSAITGITLFGRSVLVIGFGPVGRGVAERARNLGAVVQVAERDPVRALEAQHFGCQVVTLERGLSQCAIVVTATGLDGILGEQNLAHAQPGAVLFNVGHSNREIDVPWLDVHPRTAMNAHIERFDLSHGPIYLLNRGSMVNLAYDGGFAASDAFDPFSAVMLAGLHWILTGGPAAIGPGLHPFPADLEREVALETARHRGSAA